jgi:GNAT superfamily N-acetyltransferase
MTNDEQRIPLFSHVEPVLAVQDIIATIEYWQNTLGFPSKWTWGSPPNHGGVSWQKAFIQFTLSPELATASKGNSIWIRVQHIDMLYEFHQRKKADIVSPLKTQPWGMAEYSVREINGYYLHFSSPAEPREKSESTFPSSVQIIGRKPTVKEFQYLTTAPGNSPGEEDTMTQKRLDAAVFAVVAIDDLNNETIGCALLLGDGASYYYIKDVFVHPAWQGKRVGTALMQAINDWLEKNVPNKSLVALICRETLEPFYQQFGFFPAFSMIKYIMKDDEL